MYADGEVDAIEFWILLSIFSVNRRVDSFTLKGRDIDH